MIVCSCNVLSDAQVRSAIAGAAPGPRISYIYASLGCAAKCGRCAFSIKIILDEIRQFVAESDLTKKLRPQAAISQQLHRSFAGCPRVMPKAK